MKCLSPVWLGVLSGRDVDGNAKVLSVKRCIALGIGQSHPDAFYVPCGKCPLCIKAKKRDITTRIVHEMRMHGENSFITLTYNDSNLPIIDGKPTLQKSDVQKFLKLLRYYAKKPIRYFCVGEYGLKGLRPHYHLIIFGYQFDDLYPYHNAGKYLVYRSPLLEKCWRKGYSLVAVADDNCARYCAQYVQKKLHSDNTDNIIPEFFLQSKGRGEGAIGSSFFDKYYNDICNLNSCLISRNNGDIYKVPIPKYYIDRLRKKHHDKWLDFISLREDFYNDLNNLSEEQIKKDVEDLRAASAAALYKINKQNKEKTLNEKTNVYDLRFQG